MAFKEKRRWKFEQVPYPTPEEVEKANLQNLDELQGWREAEGTEKIYIQRCLLYEAEEERRLEKGLIRLVLLGVGMIWFLIKIAIPVFVSGIRSGDFLEVILGLVCVIFFGGMGLILIIPVIGSKPGKMPDELVSAVREGDFRVVDVKVRKVHDGSGSGRAVEVDDMYGKQYNAWIQTYSGFITHEYAILIQILRERSKLKNNTYVLRRYDPESKYCKKCMVEYADYH